MANLSVDLDRLRDDVCFLVGWGDDYDNASTDQQTKVTQIVNDGYREFLNAYNWSFLRPRAELTLTAPYTTGTIAISSGVVTLTGGTFPAWAAQGRISVSGGTYEVDTRDSNTQVTLEDTSVTVSSGATYTLSRVTYDLPTDFAEFGPGPLVNESENWTCVRHIQRVSESTIRMQNDYGQYTSYPRMVAHFYKEIADNTSDEYQQQVAEFYPPADQAYVISYTYIRNPSALSASNTRPLGGPRYHAALRCAVLSHAEYTIDDLASSTWTRRLEVEMKRAIDWDKHASAPRTYGKMRDTSDRPNNEYANWNHPIPPGDTYTYP